MTRQRDLSKMPEFDRKIEEEFKRIDTNLKGAIDKMFGRNKHVDMTIRDRESDEVLYKVRGRNAKDAFKEGFDVCMNK